MMEGKLRSISPAPMTKVRPAASRISGGAVESSVVLKLRLQEHLRRGVHEQRQDQREHDDDRQPLDPPEDRCAGPLCHRAPPPQPLC